MADSHPFSNAGLGMFGSAENMYAKGAMQGSDNKEGGIIGDFLAGLIGLSSKDKKKPEDKTQSQPTGSVAPTQYEPQTAFPDILQQQYVSPYVPGAGSAMPPPTTSLQGFMTPQYRAPQAPVNQMNTQPQVSSSGYHPVTDALWGK